MPRYSKTSLERLSQVDARLQKLFNAVVKYHDNSILTGHRDRTHQQRMFDTGKSKLNWPNSKHNTLPSQAVDAAPYPIPENWGEDHWKDMVKFYEFAAVVRYEAKRMNINIRWGGDWDSDGDYKDQTFDDLVHFELVR